MRHAKCSATAIGAVVFLALIFTIGSALFDGESAAQVVVEPVPAQPAPAGAQSLPPAPVVDVPGLMRLFNKPLYMGLKEQMAQPPANKQQWDELMARGLQAAEIANLVALRPVEPEREGWLQGAAGLQQAGVAFADAAKAQQWDATRQAYEGLVQACNNCHRIRAPDKAPQLKL
jgi:hypothetical protein